MNYELYIHIGYPKTGTTFLQEQVFPKTKALNYVGINLIRSALFKIMHQDEFSFNYEQVKDEIERHFNKKEKNLISFEALIGDIFYKLINNKLIADRLSVLFPRARIIISIRNQYDLIVSLYKQYIHEGGTKKFRDFINFRNGEFQPSYRISDFTINLEMFNYFGLIDYYAKLFGEKNILILPYELLKVNSEKFINKLLLWMGIEDMPLFKNINYNPGYGVGQIQIACFLNRFLKSNFRETAIIPKLNSSNLRRVLQSDISFKLLGRKSFVDETVKKKIKKIYLISNRKLSQKYNVLIEEPYRRYYF